MACISYRSNINWMKMAANRPKRKAKVSRGNGAGDTTDEGGSVTSAMERGRLAALNPQKANYIVDLMEELQSPAEAKVLDAIDALTECFQLAMGKYPELFTARMMRQEISFGHTPLEKYRGWLLECFHGFNKQLTHCLASDSSQVQERSLQVAMNIIKCEASAFRANQSRYKFPSELFGFFVRALLDRERDMAALLKVFSDQYLQFADVRVYTLKTIAKMIPMKMGAKNAKLDTHFIDNCYSVLKLVQPTMKAAQSQEEGDRWDFFVGQPDGVVLEEGSSDVEGDDSEPPKKKPKSQQKGELARVNVASLADHQKWFSEAWLAFLQLPLTSHTYKEILVYLHRDVMPHMPDPRRLIDFLTACCNVGGVISILALNGLFVLIHEYHLDFPDFYPRLYSLLDPSILHARYMQRFFHLLDVFLSSTHLPLYLVAAFVKKLSRLALTAPPHGAIVVVVMVTNLIKRHPNCKVLIHRKAESEGQGEDPFVDSEKDPMKTRALDSSLWELQTLKQHYVPKVADVATRMLSPDQLAKPEEQLGQYLDLSHSELFEEELRGWAGEKEPVMTFVPVLECFPEIRRETQT